MKNRFLTIIIVLVSTVVTGQDISGKISKRDIRELNRRIERQYRKFECFPPFDSVRIINLFDVQYEETACLSKLYIASGEFINHIKPSKIPLKRRIFEKAKRQDFSMVIKPDGELLAFYDRHKLQRHNVGWEADMAQYIVQNNIVSIYNLYQILNGFNYFGIDKDGNVHVFRLGFKTMMMCPIEEYPNDKWSELFYISWDKVVKRECEASK